MTRLWTASVEMIRMMVLLTITTAILGEVEQRLLSTWIVWHDYYGLTLLAGNVMLFFVLYRNKLQFHGWYRSTETQHKLSGKVTGVCISTAILLILAPLY